MMYVILIVAVIVVAVVGWCGITLWQRKNAHKPNYKFAIVQQALENSNLRKVIATTPQTQVVLMSIAQGSQIGEETHPSTDQIFYCVKGKATGILNDQKIDIVPNDLVIVPAGTKHNILNIGTKELKLFIIYAPPVHKATTIHATKEDAEKDTSDTYAPMEKK